MALRGTIEDFGIAEILQLIGQQTKNGELRLRGGAEEVRIWFEGGNIVAVEQTGGKESQRLGQLLVRAGVIMESELEDALDDQKRSLRRLGDILVSREIVSAAELEAMARLQATEILYRLFAWKTGSYHFEVGGTPREKGFFQPLRAEAILMEGFRMVDEWPFIKQRLPSRKVCFQKLAPLPDASRDIGPAERRMYELVIGGRTVHRLIELSRLGEFETCKALCNLLDGGFLVAREPSEAGAVRATSRWTRLWREIGVQTCLWALLAVVLVVSWSLAGANLTKVLAPVGSLQDLARHTAQEESRRRREVERLESPQPSDPSHTGSGKVDAASEAPQPSSESRAVSHTGSGKVDATSGR